MLFCIWLVYVVEQVVIVPEYDYEKYMNCIV